MTINRRWDLFFVPVTLAIWGTPAGIIMLANALAGGVPKFIASILLMFCVVLCFLNLWGVTVRIVSGKWPARWRQSAQTLLASLFAAAGDD